MSERKKLPLGFQSIREAMSYMLGAATLGYGVLEAPADKALVVVGAGLGLLGLPIVGGLFEKKG